MSVREFGLTVSAIQAACIAVAREPMDVKTSQGAVSDWRHISQAHRQSYVPVVSRRVTGGDANESASDATSALFDVKQKATSREETSSVCSSLVSSISVKQSQRRAQPEPRLFRRRRGHDLRRHHRTPGRVRPCSPLPDVPCLAGRSTEQVTRRNRHVVAAGQSSHLS
jgi:hypothetical protein